FQGACLCRVSRTTTPPFAQTGSGISAYQGDTSQAAIRIRSGRTAALSFDGSAIFQGNDAQHVLGALTNLASAVSSGDDAAIGQGIDALKRAFDRATAAQARIGTDLRAIDES